MQDATATTGTSAPPLVCEGGWADHGFVRQRDPQSPTFLPKAKKHVSLMLRTGAVLPNPSGTTPALQGPARSCVDLRDSTAAGSP